MDKASIIADAVEYVRNLQSQAKMLEDEISTLEFSFVDQDHVFQNLIDSTQFEESTSTEAQNGTTIWQIDAFEIGNRRYMVTIECENRNGAAVSLYSAIESLTCLHMDNSNLSLSSNKFIVTLTLSVRMKNSKIVRIFSEGKEIWQSILLIEIPFFFLFLYTDQRI